MPKKPYQMDHADGYSNAGGYPDMFYSHTDRGYPETWNQYASVMPLKFNRKSFRKEKKGKTRESPPSTVYTDDTFSDTTDESDSDRFWLCHKIGMKTLQIKKRTMLITGLVIAFIVTLIAVVTIASLAGKEDKAEIFAKYNMQMTVSNVNYQPAMADPASEEFINFSTDFCSEVTKTYQQGRLADNYQGCTVERLQPGSVNVFFYLTMRSIKGNLPTSEEVGVALSIVVSDIGVAMTIIGRFKGRTTSIRVTAKVTITVNTPVRCPSLTSPDNGGVNVPATRKPGSTSSYNCVAGYKLSSSVSRDCQNDGTWSGSQPSCIKILNSACIDGNDCPQTNTSCTSSTCACSAAYRVSSSNRLKCIRVLDSPCNSTAECVLDLQHTVCSNGKSCECKPGYRRTTNNRLCEIVLGSSCSRTPDCVTHVSHTQCVDTTCSCVAGYRNTADSLGCQQVRCPSLTSPDNGDVSVSATSPGSTASYNCVAGYKLSSSVSRDCQTDGTWSGSQPSCIKILGSDCSLDSDCGVTDSGCDGLVCTCLAGYRNTDDSLRCQIILCPTITAPDSGSVTVDNETVIPGSMATYICNGGFVLSGAETRNCGDDGTWTDTEPTCDKDINECTTANPCQNGATCNNSVGSYSCECTDGWQGEDCDTDIDECNQNPCENGGTCTNEPGSYTCQCDVGFSGTNCDGVLCPALAHPDSGSVTVDNETFIPGSMATYICNGGFVLSGVEIRNCGDDGTWNDTEPTCDKVLCPTLYHPDNGSVSGNDTDNIPGAMATYKCDNGFVLSGGEPRYCGDDGTWNGTEPTCEKVRCPTLDHPDNGSVSVNNTENIPGAMATYTCGDGFVLSGGETRYCGGDGTWNGTKPACEKDIVLLVADTEMKIGNQGSVEYRVEYAPGWTSIEIKRTTMDSSETETVGSVTRTGPTADPAVGDSIPYISVSTVGDVTEDSVSVELTFKYADCSDNGTYECTVYTETQSKSAIAVVNVIGVPRTGLDVPLSDLTEHNNNANFTCTADLGYPKGILVWLVKFEGDEELNEFDPKADTDYIESNTSLSNNPKSNNCTDIQSTWIQMKTRVSRWNNATLQCGVKVGEDIVQPSAIELQIIPNSFCDSRHTGRYTHPADCSYYVWCTGTSVFVQQGSCPVGQCYEPDTADCYAPSTTTTTPEPTTVTIPSGTPWVTCIPRRQYVHAGEDANFDCTLYNVDTVELIQVNDESKSEAAGLSGLLTFDHGVTLNLTLTDITGSEWDVVFQVSSVTCEDDGDYEISVNNNATVDLVVGVLVDPEIPTIDTSETWRLNQQQTLKCTGNVGRDKDQNALGTVGLQVSYDGEESFVDFDDEQPVTETPSLVCNDTTETKLYTLSATSKFNNSNVRCALKRSVDGELLASAVISVDLLSPAVSLTSTEYTSTIGSSLDIACHVSDFQKDDVIAIERADGLTPSRYDVTSNYEGVTVTLSDGMDPVLLTLTLNDVQCVHDGSYVCSHTVGNYVSKTTSSYVKVYSKPMKPKLTPPSFIVENTEQSFTCEGNVGSPNGYLVLESNTGGAFTPIHVADTPEQSEDCVFSETLSFTQNFTVEWNQTKLRCVARNNETEEDGDDIQSVSAPVQLIPETICPESGLSVVDPYNCHGYLVCSPAGHVSFRQQCSLPLCYNASGDVCTHCVDLGLCLEEFTTTEAPTTTAPPVYLTCEPTTLSGSIGDSVSLDCTAQGTSIGNVTFLNSSGEVISPDAVGATLTQTDSDTKLDIAALDCHMEGTYLVYINGEAEAMSFDFQIAVTEDPIAPFFSEFPIVFPRDQFVEVTCHGNLGRDTSKQPVADLSVEVKPSGTNTYTNIASTVVTGDPTLACNHNQTRKAKFVASNTYDGAKVRCVVRNQDGSIERVSDPRDITLSEPEVSFEDTAYIAEVGASLALKCSVRNSNSTSSIKVSRMTHFGTEETLATATSQFTNQGTNMSITYTENGEDMDITIDIMSAVCQDDTVYFCSANYASGWVQSSTQVTLTAKTDPERPTFTAPLGIIEGVQSASFSCVGALGSANGVHHIDVNKNGAFEQFQFESESVSHESACPFQSKLQFTHTFTGEWNQTDIKCAVTDDNSVLIESNEEKVNLIPADFCDDGSNVTTRANPFDCNIFFSCGSNIQFQHCSATLCYDEATMACIRIP